MARAAATGSAADFLPEQLTLPALREAAAGCHGCHLWQVGTQTVFGEGSRNASAVFVGEQPGDQEDRAGRPFVGPAGRGGSTRSRTPPRPPPVGRGSRRSSRS